MWESKVESMYVNTVRGVGIRGGENSIISGGGRFERGMFAWGVLRLWYWT